MFISNADDEEIKKFYKMVSRNVKSIEMKKY